MCHYEHLKIFKKFSSDFIVALVINIFQLYKFVVPIRLNLVNIIFYLYFINYIFYMYIYLFKVKILRLYIFILDPKE